MRGLSGKALENELNILLMTASDMSDLNGNPDEKEGAPNFYGDKDPNTPHTAGDKK
jgi:hypothetical protein